MKVFKSIQFFKINKYFFYSDEGKKQSLPLGQYSCGPVRERPSYCPILEKIN